MKLDEISKMSGRVLKVEEEKDKLKEKLNEEYRKVKSLEEQLVIFRQELNSNKA